MRQNWTETEWHELEAATRREVAAAPSESNAWRAVTRRARSVLRNYSTSFFLVTRFLPAAKRAQVDAIYAAVRYPDEVVDTFPLDPEQRRDALNLWRDAYDDALSQNSWRRSIATGIPPFVAAFAEVVRRNDIPPIHYHAFLDAMEADADSRFYRDLPDLTDHYIYGSAIVVGYFLACVYGSRTPRDRDRTLQASRDLGIALQLTNFLRDVAEDQRRGRVYLPQDLLWQHGIQGLDCGDPAQTESINLVLRRLSAIADDYYRSAAVNLDAFAPDCRIAIQACIDVYGRLNTRIGRSPLGIAHRESVPAIEKFNALPPSKIWRVPLAYLGAI